MTSQDFPFLSAAETTAAIKAKEVSPVEVVESYLQRVERLNPKLGAYITLCREEALAGARQAEMAVQRGDRLGPLFGVPVAVKDQFWTRGILTTNGSRVYSDFVPDEDAMVIERIKKAGAILLGKLNMSELAMGGTQQPPYGVPRKPLGPGADPRGVQQRLWRGTGCKPVCCLPGRGHRRIRPGARVLL